MTEDRIVMSVSSDGEEDAPGLSGFLFGNLDHNNQLDADYLDAVSPGTSGE